MGYYGNVNADLLRFIPPDAKTVLELGCGEGALYEAYLRVNPEVEWKGIDISEAAIKIAIERGVDGYFFDVDNATTIADDESADCIVLGDILEHLKDPWGKLKRLAEIATPGAQVLACIPNVQHWTVIRDLLEGKWKYTDSGLLDRTHLRFFTLNSIRKMFAEAGLQVHEIIGRDLFNDGIERFINDIQIVATKEMRAYQYVVRAIKPPESDIRRKGSDAPVVVWSFPKLHIHAVTAEACCARPRILEPFAMLGTIPRVTYTVGHWIGKPDILVLQRRELMMIRNETYRNSGAVIIAEVDDLPEALGIDSGDLRACHAIQCSTEALAEVCKQYNPNVAVFENQIADLPPLPAPIMDYQLCIFFGAQNRQSDWLPIMPALNRILAEYGKKIEVQVINDREFFDALETTEKTFTPFCEYDEYRSILGTCDIALLPLEDTSFNRCKSDIKFLECAAEGVAVIASRTVYDGALTRVEGYPVDRIERACTGIYSTPGEFAARLRTLIEEPATRQEYTENAYTYVRDNRLLSQHYRARYEWYQSLLSSKQALDQSLADRVPELSAHLAPA